MIRYTFEAFSGMRAEILECCESKGAEQLGKPVRGGEGGDMVRHLSLRRLDLRPVQLGTARVPGQLG